MGGIGWFVVGAALTTAACAPSKPVAGVALIGAGSGHMLVDAYVVAGNGRRPRYLGRYSGSSFGALSDEEIAAGQEIGHDIAESLYRTPD